MSEFLSFLLGLMLGGFAGVAACAACNAARPTPFEEDLERMGKTVTTWSEEVD